MGRTGSALVNAAAGSFNCTLEWELLRDNHFHTRKEARHAVAAWIDNYKRIISIPPTACSVLSITNTLLQSAAGHDTMQPTRRGVGGMNPGRGGFATVVILAERRVRLRRRPSPGSGHGQGHCHGPPDRTALIKIKSLQPSLYGSRGLPGVTNGYRKSMTASGSFVADVTRVVRPSRKALYENYIDPAIPVVIAPDIAQQEKGGLLTPEGLRRRFEDKLITVKVAEDRTLRANPKRREIPFNDYVAYVEGTPDGGDLQYAAQIPFDDTYEGVEANMVAPILPDPALIKGGSWLWFGPSGTVAADAL